MRKSILVLLALVVSVAVVFPPPPLVASKQPVSLVGFETSNDNGSYVIADVPYVSQETDFYCQFACPTMIFKYYGINTSLHEVLYNSGVGYGMVYSPPYLKRFPVGCIGSCKWYADRSFLATLYGFSYENDRVDDNLPEKERWHEYWERVKQNLTDNIPIITNADPAMLVSMRNSIRKALHISEGVWTGLTDHLWEAAPSGILHAILLVGFNETNGTVCFHDPAAALWGHPETGTYTWMNLTKFRKAIWRVSLYNPYQAYSIELFTDTLESPLDTTTMFERVYARNIQKIKGDLSVYDEHVVYDWGCSQLGINAVKEVKNDMGYGIQHRVLTTALYRFICISRLYSLGYKLCRFVNITFPSVFNFSESQNIINDFDLIAIEKQNMSQYLNTLQYLVNDTNISAICKRDAMLLTSEAENWTKLGSYFSRFLRSGVAMTLPYGILIIRNMERVLTDIISLEEEIISRST